MPSDKNYFDESAARWDDHPQRVAMMRAVGEAIVRQARPTRDVTVMDYGCGTGLVGLYLLPHVRSVTGADNSAGMLEMLGRKIAEGGLENMRAVRLDLQTDPAPGERYGMIVASMSLHHIGDVERTLRAFHEMLLPGGVVCIADLDTEPGTFHSGPAAASVHHHGFDRAEMIGLLESVGFVEAKDSTVIEFTRPVEGGGEATYSIFLITAKRP